jgi:Zn finger protein HypA/HybF involved in hydrogenase expression
MRIKREIMKIIDQEIERHHAKKGPGVILKIGEMGIIVRDSILF